MSSVSTVVASFDSGTLADAEPDPRPSRDYSIAIDLQRQLFNGTRRDTSPAGRELASISNMAVKNASITQVPG